MNKLKLEQANWILLDVDGTIIQLKPDDEFSIFNKLLEDQCKELGEDHLTSLLYGFDEKLKAINRNDLLEEAGVNPQLFWDGYKNKKKHQISRLSVYPDALKFLNHLKDFELLNKIVLVSESPLLNKVYELLIKPVVEIKFRVITNKPTYSETINNLFKQKPKAGNNIMIGDTINDALFIKNAGYSNKSVIVIREHNNHLKEYLISCDEVNLVIDGLDELI